ncbi:hypothetical protein CIY_34050 [Butyrivibrio fibrisolvens 16/4]|nr:hypothetical protein CIY_34050 [Butyrivibrio fibrisolvens 16/4]
MFFETSHILDVINVAVALMEKTDADNFNSLTSQEEFGIEVVVAEALHHFSYFIKDGGITLEDAFKAVGINYNKEIDFKFEMSRELGSNFNTAFLVLIYKVEQYFTPDIRGAQLIRAQSVHRGANHIKMDLLNDLSFLEEILKGARIKSAPDVPRFDQRDDYQRSKLLIDALAKTAVDIQIFVSSLNERKAFFEDKYKHVYKEHVDISQTYLAEQELLWDRAFSWITWQHADDEDLPFS